MNVNVSMVEKTEQPRTYSKQPHSDQSERVFGARVYVVVVACKSDIQALRSKATIFIMILFTYD